MNIALVHELLTMRGGAERVVKILTEMFPEAPIYTLLYDEKKLGDWFPKEKVRTSSLQKFAGFTTNHHLYLPFFPRAVEAWDFSEFDVVLSTSSSFAHGIITNGNPKHLCYVNAPARYLWDRTHDVLEKAGKGLLGPLRKKYLQYVFHKLRTWDAEVAARPDKLITTSKEVQRRIELYWRRESDVVYPPVDDFWLQGNFGGKVREQSDYFLIVSTLVPYKRIDIAIEACNTMKAHLKIVGEGPERKRLEALAGPTIEFYGYRERDELGDLFADARAVIFPGDEDFGLVPLEAMACGTPVIAFRKGGALETIQEGRTGTFFDEPTSASLLQTLQGLRTFSSDDCRKRAEEFSCVRFEADIRKAIAEL